LASAVPVITKEVSLVTKSLLEDPVSLLEARARVVGADGALVSTVTVKAVEAEDALPAVSVALAVIALLPAVNVPVVQENAPLPSAVHVLPVATPPTYS
jgi:hypothetical protein